MRPEERLELGGDVGSGEIDAVVAEELLLHLGELLLGGGDLAEDEGDLLGDEGDVLAVVAEEVPVGGGGAGVGEGVEGEDVGGDDGEEHEEVEGGGADRGPPEPGGAVAYLQGDRPHCGGPSPVGIDRGGGMPAPLRRAERVRFERSDEASADL